MSERRFRAREVNQMWLLRRGILLVVISVAIGLLIADRLHLFVGDYHSNRDFGIADYISEVDGDGDGVDDQSDILAGVRAYIATNPKYKSKYYAGGYPTDQYGVCTDVVAQGFLAAGYDLRELVSADIAERRSAYDIKTPDKNIDFRRVRNLKVFFEEHAAKQLTCDITEIGEWQGGDIVIFSNSHIGIVSDKRNRDGVVLLIHHGSPMQAGYEQDIMEENAEEIVGHYRWR